MRAIVVDDERVIANSVKRALEVSPDIDSVEAFNSGEEALDFMESREVDIAFIDIKMWGMDGLELAERIQEEQEKCAVIFCSEDGRFALEAFRRHVSGYLIKPLTVEDVQGEINHVKERRCDVHDVACKKGCKGEKKIFIRCFGEFEVYADGKPLAFQRIKSKELLAYMVDRKGAGVTSRQLCAVLWEDEGKEQSNRSYLRNLIADCRQTLKTACGEDVMLRKGTEYYLNLDLIDCDYFSFCETGKPEFRGEYMSQYSWAEATCGYLDGKNF